MSTIRLDYYGVEGTGKTVKEAKADAGRQIERMLKGDYVPEIITFQGHAIIVWRELYGWYTRSITDGEAREIRAGRLNGSASHGSKAEAVLSARMQLAQNAFTPDNTILTDYFEILDKSQERDFVSWARFQMKYAELKADGLPEADCYRQACEAMYA